MFGVDLVPQALISDIITAQLIVAYFPPMNVLPVFSDGLKWKCKHHDEIHEPVHDYLGEVHVNKNKLKTSPSKSDYTGVRNLKWKCAICLIRLHTSALNYAHLYRRFCSVRSHVSIFPFWLINTGGTFRSGICIVKLGHCIVKQECYRIINQTRLDIITEK